MHATYRQCPLSSCDVALTPPGYVSRDTVLNSKLLTKYTRARSLYSEEAQEPGLWSTTKTPSLGWAELAPKKAILLGQA